MSAGVRIRLAEPRDVTAICDFGDACIPPHYAPLIGAEAAAAQVTQWWNKAYIRTAVADGLITVAELADHLVGVAQRGRAGPRA